MVALVDHPQQGCGQMVVINLLPGEAEDVDPSVRACRYSRMLPDVEPAREEFELLARS
jgi:hypothetical protein